MRGCKLKILKIVLKVVGITLAAVFAVATILIIQFNRSFGDEFVKDRFLGEYTSPDENHVCSVHISGDGLIMPWTVMAQVKGKGILWKRTIYTVKNIDEAVVIWLDDRTIWINGVKLDIYEDKYVSDIYDLEPK